MQSRSKLLVFPTSRVIREYINSQKENNTLLPTILTIDEFFKKSLNLGNRKYIDEEERFLYLVEAVSNLNLSKLGISTNFLQFIKQSDYIYRFFLELASENVDINSISNEDTYGYYSEHLDILKIIQKSYLEILEKNNAIDKINIEKHYKINYDFVKRYSRIEIDFEGYFTSFEFNLIKEIARESKVEINFIYNKYNKKSIEKFINLGFDLKLEHEYKIDFSNKEIISEEEIRKKTVEIDIKGFSSRINQIAFIKKSVSDLVNSGIEASKIALILPEESFASRISLFDKERYFNYAMGLNIYTSNLYKVIDAIYLYINEKDIKNTKNIEFLKLDKNVIVQIFENHWNRNLTSENFNKIMDYFLLFENDEELIEKFKELVFKLERLFFSSSERITLKDAYKILHQKVSKISLDDVNSGKITVMGLLESRKLVFDAVIICDFNENYIPKRSVKDKFLSSNIKSKVNLPTKVDRENLQKYYYERLISNTSKVFISYVKNDNEQISRFANTLFDININEKLFDNSYKHILYSNKTIKHFVEEVILDIDLSKLTWSASSLKEYLECKRKYYLNHILKIKEHDISIKPKGYELGNIIHNSLEVYYKQGTHTYEKLLGIINDMSKEKVSNNSFLNLDLEIWKKKLVEFVKKEEKRFEDNLKIISLEEPFLIEYEDIKLRGTIDRVDLLGETYIVLDYKTSSNLKLDTIRTYEKAIDFQLEFYYLAIENLYKTTNIKTYYYDLYNMKLQEEVVLEEKLESLREIFNNLNTKSVNFLKCDNNQICQYCTYKVLCNRD
ncbi:PD-(D/E)XK nuclease family protein [Arcobacter sp. LA11]|uniref:PD-(D/E)XK nuclease family protein n=1 Tax=Arcobacter sp. LA11 TaxID=1898176 RepID=UPI000933E886|nr:PD-(D/E)XK nuclease family protein [Arcobacter sp. LA11]